MRTLACLGSWTLGACLTLGAQSAFAEDATKDYAPCEKKPTSGETSAAKGAFQAGQAAFNEADYGRAITYWEDAFRRDCTASPLLLNLARAYELDGQKRHAVLALSTFVARNPGSSDESGIKRRIEKLNDQINSEAVQQSISSSASTTSGSAPAAASSTPEATGSGPAAAPATPPDQSESGQTHRSAVPLVVAGVGGALAIVGGVVFFAARSKISDVEAACGGRTCAGKPDLASEGNAARTRATIGGALGIAGLAGAVGGTVWYFAQPSRTSTTAASPGFRAGVRPSVGFGYTGVDLVGRF